MKFTVQSCNIGNTKMRLGQINEIQRIPNSVLLTPLLLLYTKSGSVTHLTREVLEMVTNISSHALQIPLANSAHCTLGSKHFQEGISKFVGLTECLSYCSVQDPGEVSKVGYNDRNTITIWTHVGRKLLTPNSYMDMIESLRPDLYHVLCDGDTNKESSRKRAQKSVDVTTNMFLTCAERHNKSQRLKESAMLAVLEGGYNLDARLEAVQMFSRHPGVLGFVIDGLHNNGPPVEQMSYEDIEPVITETLKHVPEDKLRVVHGAWRPDVLLRLVRAGVDVFDSSLVYLLTQRGCAFTFKYHSLVRSNGAAAAKCAVNGHHCDKDVTTSDTKTVNKGCDSSVYEINLHDKRYTDDLTPVMRDCSCLTCTQHTRAYIHHLLNVREMLAQVLLMVHNMHHYEQFFNAIRESGKHGQQVTLDPSFNDGGWHS